MGGLAQTSGCCLYVLTSLYLVRKKEMLVIDLIFVFILKQIPSHEQFIVRRCFENRH